MAQVDLSEPAPDEAPLPDEMAAMESTGVQKASTGVEEQHSALADAQKQVQDDASVEMFHLEELQDAAAVAAKAERADSLTDWYGLDDSTANERIQQSSDIPAAGDDAAADQSGDKARPRVPKWLGGLGSGAKKLTGNVKKAMVSEAKLLVQDMKELGGHIKEGAQYTAEDSKVLAQNIRSNAKTYVEDTKPLLSKVRKEGFRSVMKQGEAGEALADTEADKQDNNESTDAAASDATATASSSSTAPPQTLAEESPSSAENSQQPTLPRDSSSGSRLIFKRFGPVWQDLQEAGKEIVTDFGETKEKVRQAWRDQQSQPQPDGTSGESGLEAAGVGVRAKLWQQTTALVGSVASLASDRLREEEAVTPCSDCYWALPSSRANYIMLTEEALLEAAEAELAGGEASESRRIHLRRLAGNIARRREEVSQGIARRARDVGQRWQGSASPVRRRPEVDAYAALPSTRANYVLLLDPDDEDADAFFVPKKVSGEIRRIAGRLDADARKLASRLDDDVTERIGRLGDRIDEDGRKAFRGLAKRKEKVSQGLADTARDVGHKFSAASPSRRRSGKDYGDDIFEIGSEDDDDDIQWLDHPQEDDEDDLAPQEASHSTSQLAAIPSACASNDPPAGLLAADKPSVPPDTYQPSTPSDAGQPADPPPRPNIAEGVNAGCDLLGGAFEADSKGAVLPEPVLDPMLMASDTKPAPPADVTSDPLDGLFDMSLDAAVPTEVGSTISPASVPNRESAQAGGGIAQVEDDIFGDIDKELEAALASDDD
mmetsp:Transcript_8769/g.19440  ORF Transcript_8769/g.19440 Transcript_8769/m.19440 type:complete len:773 (-) Transcript_8769:12-2330(-)